HVIFVDNLLIDNFLHKPNSIRVQQMGPFWSMELTESIPLLIIKKKTVCLVVKYATRQNEIFPLTHSKFGSKEYPNTTYSLSLGIITI
ncbi:hypothetical protein OFL77_26885, partial [Escherichia coli]|uniref:hypothetical protein n=1 Tax=Escherichia coli TaxID=562 RepID=UPI0021DF5C87